MGLVYWYNIKVEGDIWNICLLKDIKSNRKQSEKCQSSINGILWELPDRRGDRKRNFPLHRFGKKTADHRGKMKNKW